jgi:formamidopyrimidine-DNA glycosylase
MGESRMLCRRCGGQMRLFNQARALLLLYWCPTCQRFEELRR